MASHRVLRILITSLAGVAAASSLAQTMGGNSVPDTWASLTAETPTLVGGLTTRCNARLIVGANPGQTVLLISNTVKIAVPASVSFVTGRKNAYFNAKTQTMLADGTGTITASLNGYVRTLTLTLLVGGLTDGSFQATILGLPSVEGSEPQVGAYEELAVGNVVWLSGTTFDNVVVELRSDNPAVLAVSPSVTVRAGNFVSGPATLTPMSEVLDPTPIVIRAKYGNSLRYFTVTVMPNIAAGATSP